MTITREHLDLAALAAGHTITSFGSASAGCWRRVAPGCARWKPKRMARGCGAVRRCCRRADERRCAMSYEAKLFLCLAAGFALGLLMA